jgi:hypothetical protein
MRKFSKISIQFEYRVIWSGTRVLDYSENGRVVEYPIPDLETLIFKLEQDRNFRIVEIRLDSRKNHGLFLLAVINHIFL